MRKETLSAGMIAHLGSEPALHPANFGTEIIIRRMDNEPHPIQIDKRKNGEDIPALERIASEATEFSEVAVEIPTVKGNGTKAVCLPLPLDEMLNGHLLGVTFAKHDNSAHVFTQDL
jgi:hypothetical protein